MTDSVLDKEMIWHVFVWYEGCTLVALAFALVIAWWIKRKQRAIRKTATSMFRILDTPKCKWFSLDD